MSLIAPCAARTTTTAKKTGGKLGLGVKKLESKVDDSIYAQVRSLCGAVVCLGNMQIALGLAVLHSAQVVLSGSALCSAGAGA